MTVVENESMKFDEFEDPGLAQGCQPGIASPGIGFARVDFIDVTAGQHVQTASLQLLMKELAASHH